MLEQATESTESTAPRVLWGELWFRLMLEKLPAGAYTCDPDGLITYYNTAAVHVWGRAPKLNDPVDRYCGSFKLYSATDGSPLAHDRCWMARALKERQPYIGEEIVVERPDGQKITALAHANPLYDDMGNLLGAVNILIDITERKRAEQDRALLSAIVESSEDAILSKTPDGRILSWNSGAVRLFGYTPSEVIGQPITILIPPERLDEEDVILSRLRRGERLEHFETVRVAKDGRAIEISLTVSPVRDSSGKIIGVSSVARDVSRQKAAERALHRSELNFQDFFENGVLGLHWAGPDGTVLRVNQAELDLLGYTREEVLGRHFSEFHADSETAAEIFRRLEAGETLENFEARLRRKDGEIRHVLISSNVLWENGQFIHTRCFTRDITERRRMEEALRLADRRKNEFLAMLSHELRNPLAPLANSLDLLRRAGNTEVDVARLHTVMERQVGQLTRLVDDLLEISRISLGKIELKKEPVQLGDVLQTAIETSQPFIDAHAHRLIVGLPSEPITIQGDPVRLGQIFSNLLNNAARYSEAPGQIWLTARSESDEVVVSVRDSGVGIPPEHLEHVFEWFWQLTPGTETSRPGLGIGLSLVRQLVQLHGGSVEAHSNGRGTGSEFIVRLPRLPESRPAEPSPVRENGHRLAGPPHRILVVDDNQDAADTIGMLLEVLGETAVVAYDGHSALDAALKHRPAVMFVDIGMPGMDGLELARQIRADPKTRDVFLVALTGWSQEADRSRSTEAGFDHHIVKPVRLQALEAVLEKLAFDRAQA